MDHLKTMEIAIAPTSTIGDLKYAIAAQNHILWPEYQRLYTASVLRPFPNMATLDACGIREGSTVKMDYALKLDDTAPA